MAKTEPAPIPAHRHEIVTRSGEPRTIEGGDDDAPSFETPPAAAPQDERSKNRSAPDTKRAD